MPYPNEHSCRIRNPEDFDPKSFRRIEKGNPALSIIIGKLKGEDKTTTQAFRYPIDEWTEEAARANCEDQGGTFEAAKKKEMSDVLPEVIESDADKTQLKNKSAINLLANLTGEISVSDIPVAPSINLEKLKEGDPDPLEVVVEINSGLSSRKWNYLPDTVKKIVDQINERTPNGFLGHQKPEDIDSEFPDVATHWIGALFRDGKAFVRGYVDPSMAKLKRLIKSNRVKQVSVFGIPTLAKQNGETQVTDYQLLSLDWTPLDRNGMPTRVVATSEMATLDLFNEFDSIAAHNSSKSGTPGGETMTKEEMLTAMKSLLITGEMKKEELKALIGDVDENIKVKDLAKKLNVEPDKLEGEIDRLLGIEQGVEKEKHDKLVEKVLKEKIADETIRGLVGEILQSGIEDDEKKITSDIEVVLQKDVIKKAIGELHVDGKAPAGTAGKDTRQFTQFEKAKII